jgi:hypothetical protein
MDVERTMQFILEQQADFTVRVQLLQKQQADFADNMQQLQQQQQQFAANMDRFRQETETRFDKHDKQIKAIRILLRAGMKLLVQVQEQQKQTDARLQALIESLGRGRNGHSQ